MSAYQASVHHGSSNIQGGQILAPPGLHHLQMVQQLPMPGGSTILPQQRPGGFNTGQLVQGTQLLSHRLQSGQLIQPGNPGNPMIGNPATGQLPSSFSRASGNQLLPDDPSNVNSDRGHSQAGVPVSGLAQQQVVSRGHIMLQPTQEQGQHVTDSAGQAVQTRLDGNRTSAIPHGAVSSSSRTEATSDPKLSQEQGLQWSREVEEEERIASAQQQQAGEISNNKGQ